MAWSAKNFWGAITGRGKPAATPAPNPFSARHAANTASQSATARAGAAGIDAANRTSARTAANRAAQSAASRYAAAGIEAENSRLYPVVETPQSSWVTRFSYIYRGGKTGMLIEFKDGARCFYPGTDAWLYSSMNQAPSKGKWVHANVYHLNYELI